MSQTMESYHESNSIPTGMLVDFSESQEVPEVLPGYEYGSFGIFERDESSPPLNKSQKDQMNQEVSKNMYLFSPFSETSSSASTAVHPVGNPLLENLKPSVTTHSPHLRHIRRDSPMDPFSPKWMDGPQDPFSPVFISGDKIPAQDPFSPSMLPVKNPEDDTKPAEGGNEHGAHSANLLSPPPAPVPLSESNKSGQNSMISDSDSSSLLDINNLSTFSISDVEEDFNFNQLSIVDEEEKENSIGSPIVNQEGLLEMERRRHQIVSSTVDNTIAASAAKDKKRRDSVKVQLHRLSQLLSSPIEKKPSSNYIPTPSAKGKRGQQQQQTSVPPHEWSTPCRRKSPISNSTPPKYSNPGPASVNRYFPAPQTDNPCDRAYVVKQLTFNDPTTKEPSSPGKEVPMPKAKPTAIVSATRGGQPEPSRQFTKPLKSTGPFPSNLNSNPKAIPSNAYVSAPRGVTPSKPAPRSITTPMKTAPSPRTTMLTPNTRRNYKQVQSSGYGRQSVNLNSSMNTSLNQGGDRNKSFVPPSPSPRCAPSPRANLNSSRVLNFNSSITTPIKSSNKEKEPVKGPIKQESVNGGVKPVVKVGPPVPKFGFGYRGTKK